MILIEVKLQDYFFDSEIIQDNVVKFNQLIKLSVVSTDECYEYIYYDYPYTNIKIRDDLGNYLTFYMDNSDLCYNLYVNVNDVSSLFVEISNKYKNFTVDNCYSPYSVNIENVNLFNNQQFDGNNTYLFYIGTENNYISYTNLIQDYEKLNKTGDVQISDNIVTLIGNQSLFDKQNKVIINPQYKYFQIMKYNPITISSDTKIMFGGVRYNQLNKLVGGFSDDILYRYDVWDQFEDVNIGEITRYGNFRYGINEQNSSWGNGDNTTKYYNFGLSVFANPSEIILINKQVMLYQSPQLIGGMHINKNDMSNNHIKLIYNIQDYTNRSVKFCFTRLEEELSNLSLTFKQSSSGNSSNLNIIINKDNLQQYKNIYNLQISDQQDFDGIQSLNFEKYNIELEDTFTIQIFNYKNCVIVYINDIMIYNKNKQESIIFNIQEVQQGIFGQFTGKTNLILNYIKSFNINNTINTTNISQYTHNPMELIPNIIIDGQQNSSIFKHQNIICQVDYYLPVSIKLQENIYPYLYKFGEIGEEYLNTLQYNNYYIKYTSRSSILEKIYSKVLNIESIENFMWRQTTPFYIREENYQNDLKYFSLFIHVMSNITQRVENITDRFQDLSFPYQTDLYNKRTLYLYLNDIGLLKDFINLENDKQIYNLISINFYKNIIYYNEFRGLYDPIDKILDDQLKDISASLQLYIVIFRKLRDVIVYEYSSKQNIIKFKQFLQDGGSEIIFNKQKFQYMVSEKDYIIGLDKELYKKFKFVDGINDYRISEILQSYKYEYVNHLIYRSMIVIYDDFLVDNYNLEESIVNFLRFIKENFLPQNMEIILVKMSELDLDLRDEMNREQFNYNYATFNFNMLLSNYNNYYMNNSNNFNSGKII